MLNFIIDVFENLIVLNSLKKTNSKKITKKCACEINTKTIIHLQKLVKFKKKNCVIVLFSKNLHKIKKSQIRRIVKSNIYRNFVLCTYLICILDILINIIFIFLQDFNIIVILQLK